MGDGMGLLSVIGQMLSNRAMRKAQERAQEWNLEQWNRENAYNHPSAQMERLRSAGLNPALMYGGSVSGASGTAESVAPAKAAENESITKGLPVLHSADIEMREAQTDNLRAQNLVLQEEKLLKAAQTANVGINTSKSEFDLQLAKKLLNTTIAQSQANLDKTMADIDSVKATTENTVFNTDFAKELRGTSADIKREELRKYKLQNTGAELDNITKELNNRYQNETLTNRVKLVFEELYQAAEHSSQAELETQIKQTERELAKYGLDKSDPAILKMWQMYLEKIKNFNAN